MNKDDIIILKFFEEAIIKEIFDCYYQISCSKEEFIKIISQKLGESALSAFAEIFKKVD